MELGTLLLIFIGLAVFVMLFWNVIILRRTVNLNKVRQKLDDKQYYELKYKQEYFVAVVSFIGTALIILGYNNIDSVKTALKAEFTKKTDSTNARLDAIAKHSDSLSAAFDAAVKEKLRETNEKLDQMQQSSSKLATATEKQLRDAQTIIATNANTLKHLGIQQSEIESRFKSSDDQLKKAIARIEELNSRNILKQNYYIVDSLKFDMDKYFNAPNYEEQYATYYFKDLRTTIGDKLPKFKTPPFLVSFSDGNAFNGKFRNVTTESFKFQFDSYIEGAQKIFYFKVLVSESQ